MMKLAPQKNDFKFGIAKTDFHELPLYKLATMTPLVEIYQSSVVISIHMYVQRFKRIRDARLNIS